MTSMYSVIQYLPNPLTDERINIGVLVFDDKETRVHFLAGWRRVHCFAPEGDLGFLKKFAAQMHQAVDQGLLFPGDELNELPKHERLSKLAKNWRNSIQFTEPRGSLESAESLVEKMASTYLMEPSSKKAKLRDRQAAARVAKNHVRKVLTDKLGDKAKELLRLDYPLRGIHTEHKLDVTVANGRPFFAAHGISFEIQTPETVMNSLAWMIVDIREYKPDFPLAVIALPPTEHSPDRKRLENLYKRTTGTYRDLGAYVLEEEQLDHWVNNKLEELTAS